MGSHANQKKLETFSKSVVCLELMGSVIGPLNLTGQEILQHRVPFWCCCDTLDGIMYAKHGGKQRFVRATVAHSMIYNLQY